MKVAIWGLYGSIFSAGYALREVDAPIGDELLAPYVDLAKLAATRNVQLVPLDAPEAVDADWVLFSDAPHPDDPVAARAKSMRAKKALITFEPPVVYEANWLPWVHDNYDRIFTWNDDLVVRGGKRFHKIHYSVRVNNSTLVRNVSKENLACMVASNKGSVHELELYSARRRAINWWSAAHPGKFDLYGMGWPQQMVVYRGVCDSKRQTIAKYHFNICYENAQGLPGYITEKILDCFLAGTIPVYFGAPNIEQYVPRDAYVNAGAFSDHESLYRHLVDMSHLQRQRMVNAGTNFLLSEASRVFTTQHFATTILNNL